MNHIIASKEYVIKKMVEFGAKPSKKWGQNFLIDDGVASAIVKSLAFESKKRVLEIGPGLGALSSHLVNSGSSIDLLEIDSTMAAHLQNEFKFDTNVKVICADVLKSDISGYDYIIGNLPYYITTPIIEKVLANASAESSFVAMVQREVYPRIIAKLGSEEYGPLSIIISYLGSVRQVLKVSKYSFLPAPHVDSLVFKIDFRKDLDRKFANKLIRVTKGMFLLRRKTIMNNLLSYTNDKEKSIRILEDLKTPANKRPEELPLSFYVGLAQLLTD